ncbi:MAG: formate dehydrogenase subunit delta [Novosphingobium sp.]
MEIERLRYMADQIARNFAAMGEEEAIAATADHIDKFWDPRMRAQLLADDREAHSPVVAAAVARLAAA